MLQPQVRQVSGQVERAVKLEWWRVVMPRAFRMLGVLRMQGGVPLADRGFRLHLEPERGFFGWA